MSLSQRTILPSARRKQAKPQKRHAQITTDFSALARYAECTQDPPSAIDLISMVILAGCHIFWALDGQEKGNFQLSDHSLPEHNHGKNTVQPWIHHRYVHRERQSGTGYKLCLIPLLKILFIMITFTAYGNPRLSVGIEKAPLKTALFTIQNDFNQANSTLPLNLTAARQNITLFNLFRSASWCWWWYIHPLRTRVLQLPQTRRGMPPLPVHCSLHRRQQGHTDRHFHLTQSGDRMVMVTICSRLPLPAPARNAP